MEDNKKEPQLDERAIDWPSGHVTLARIREVEPYVCDFGWRCDERADRVEILNLYEYERQTAQNVFARSLGRKLPDSNVSREMLVECLEETYRKYGIASGPAQTKELMRRIEDAAIKQAMAFGGKDPRILGSRDRGRHR